MNHCENHVIMMPSATFELRMSPTDGQWHVIGVHGTRSGTAHAMMGLPFTPGANPQLWAQGYAMRLQAAINKLEVSHG